MPEAGAVVKCFSCPNLFFQKFMLKKRDVFYVVREFKVQSRNYEARWMQLPSKKSNKGSTEGLFIKFFPLVTKLILYMKFPTKTNQEMYVQIKRCDWS